MFQENRGTFTIIVIIMIAFIIVGGGHIIAGLMLGTLSTVGMIMVYVQLPLWLRKLFARFHLIVDITMGIVVFRLFGVHTATAIQGAALNSILFSFFLVHQRNKLIDNNRISTLELLRRM